MKDIEDEIPFEVPEGWAWCRLPSVCEIPITDGTHQTPTYSDKENGIPFLSSKDVTSQKIDWSKIKYITKDLHEELQKRVKPQRNDILLAKNGTTGVAAIVETDDIFDIYVTLALLRPCKQLNPRFLLHMVNSPFCKDQFNGHLTGIGVPNLHLNDICKTLVPVPPYSEQIQIVNEIEKTTTLIDSVEKDKSDLQTVIKQAKSKILDLAIHGKLVPQDPSDESASVLLEKLRTEKEAKIKAGELKRDKNDSYIYKNTTDNCYYEKFNGKDPVCIDEEIPFDIPDNWQWVKLNELADIARGGSPRPIEAFITDSSEGINWIKIGDTSPESKYIISAKEKIIPEGKKHSRYVHSGDFLLTNSMSFGRPYILKIDGCIHDGWLVFGDIKESILQDYLYLALSSDYVYNAFSLVAAGSTVKNLKSETVKATLFPLPPISEQKRIVSKIEEMFERLDQIQNNLI